MRDFTVEQRGNFDIVMAAVRKRGDALEHASKKLRGNQEIVQAAVQQSGFALRFATSLLRLDRKRAIAAAEQGGRATRKLCKSVNFIYTNFAVVKTIKATLYIKMRLL